MACAEKKDVKAKFVKSLEQVQVFTPPTNRRIEEIKKLPEWNEEYMKLQTYLSDKVPGTHVVPSKDEGGELFIDCIINETGTPFWHVVKDEKAEIQFEPGKEIEPQANVMNLYINNKIDVVIFGYALSKDGLWRFHAWGLITEKRAEDGTITPGRIVETGGHGHLVYVGDLVDLNSKDE